MAKNVTATLRYSNTLGFSIFKLKKGTSITIPLSTENNTDLPKTPTLALSLIIEISEPESNDLYLVSGRSFLSLAVCVGRFRAILRPRMARRVANAAIMGIMKLSLAQFRNPLLWAILFVAVLADLLFPVSKLSHETRIAVICQDSKIHLCTMEPDGSGQQKHIELPRFDSVSMNRLGEIAFICKSTDPFNSNNSELCLMKADWKSHKQLTNEGTRLSSPSINDRGKIVYECEQPNIALCVIDSDGSNRRLLTDVIKLRASNGWINNRGEIAFVCQEARLNASIEFCLVKEDSTGFRKLTQNSNHKGHFSFNDAGEIAFECFPKNSFAAADREICYANLHSQEVVQITDNDEFDAFPEITDYGVILYTCGHDTGHWSGVCSSATDGTDHRHLTADLGGYHPSINETGHIVFECGSPLDVQICIINKDGQELRFFDDAFAIYKEPIIR